MKPCHSPVSVSPWPKNSIWWSFVESNRSEHVDQVRAGLIRWALPPQFLDHDCDYQTMAHRSARTHTGEAMLVVRRQVGSLMERAENTRFLAYHLLPYRGVLRSIRNAVLIEQVNSFGHALTSISFGSAVASRLRWVHCVYAIQPAQLAENTNVDQCWKPGNGESEAYYLLE